MTSIPDLSHNPLKISPHIQSQLPAIQIFHLAGVSVNCSCQNAAFMRWIKQTPGSKPNCMQKTRHFAGVLDTECAVVGALKQTSPRQTPDPSKYNPMLGWYTAGTLSAMLLGFILCLALERLKAKIWSWFRERKARKNAGKKYTELRKHSRNGASGTRLSARSAISTPRTDSVSPGVSSLTDRSSFSINKVNKPEKRKIRSKQLQSMQP